MDRSIVLLACVRLAASLTLPTVAPTRNNLARDVEGWSPRTTPNPQGLFKRDRAGPRTCGWYEDEFGPSTMTCYTGTCMAYTAGGAGAMGCCTATQGGLDYQSCGWVSKCYDYFDILSGRCDSDCQTNTFNRACTSSDYPYCVSWTYPAVGAKDYGCGYDSASMWISVSTDVANSEAGTATAQIPFVPAAATITGFIAIKAGSIPSGTSGATATSTSVEPSLPSASGSARTVGIAAVVAVIIIAIGMYCVGGCIVAWFCVRSKRNVAKWTFGSTVALLPAGRPGAPPTSSSNVPSELSGSYFQPNNGPQNVGYYNGNEHKTSPFTTAPAAHSSPMSSAPPYAGHQPPQRYAELANAQPFANQPGQGWQYGAPQGINAVEAPANSTSRPHYAELG